MGRGQRHCSHIKPLWVPAAMEALALGSAPPSCQALLGVCQEWGQNSFSLISLQVLQVWQRACPLSPGFVLSNVAMPGEGEVGEGQVEMVTSRSMGSGTKGWSFREGVIKGTGEIQTGRDPMALARCQEKKACIFYLCLPWLHFILSFPSFLIYDLCHAPLC